MEVCLFNVNYSYLFFSCFDRKCIRMGMKKEGKYVLFFVFLLIILNILAVQKERDRLGRQRSHNYNYDMANIKVDSRLTGDINEDEDDLSVMALVKAEQTAQEV
jgi:hypothetical protein